MRQAILQIDKNRNHGGSHPTRSQFSGGKLECAEAAVVHAVQRLNTVGMALTFSVKDVTPGIAIHPLDTARGERPAGSDAPLLNNLTMANASRH